MKKRTRAVIYFGILLSSLFVLTGCSQSRTNLAVEKNWHSQFVKSQNLNLAMYDLEVSFPDALGYSSSAEIMQASDPLPPEIIKLILTSKGSIGSLVWDDNGNKVHDTGETGIPNITVFVDLNGDGTKNPGEPFAITDDNGRYKIHKVKPGQFDVRVDITTLKSGYFVITDNPVSVNILNNQRAAADFGAQNQSASLIGLIWNDSDKNGSINNSETPLSGVTVYVDTNNDGSTLGDPNATTNFGGQYQIQRLPLGTFDVILRTDTLSAIYQHTIVTGSNPITVNFQHQKTSSADFGFQKKVTISGTLRDNNGNTWGSVTLFIDLNGNGVYDKGEPVTKTDIYGRYMFDNLYPGSYTIMILGNQLPGGYNNSLLSLTLGEGINYTVDLLLLTRSGFAPVSTLQSPTRLSLGSNGNIYVSDNQIGSVFVFDGAFTLLNELKGLDKPLGVNTDASGNIYVGVQGSRSVIKYDTSGNYLTTFGKGNIETPNDITFDRADNIYIMDSDNDTVLVYNQTGTLLRSIGNPAQLDYGVSIAIHYRDNGAGGEIGELYVADLRKSLIQVFTLDGSYQRSIGGPAYTGKYGDINTLTWEGLFSGLKAISFDQNGILHALDSSLNVIEKFDPITSTYLGYYDAYKSTNATKLNLQTDLSINALGQVFQANEATKNIEHITTIP